MVEYVERAKLISDLKELPEQERIEYMGIYDCIRSQPTADVAEVRHGEWVEDGYDDIPCVCSYCGAEALYNSTFELQFDYDWEENLVPCGYEEHRVYIKTPFCPNCGAKMDGKEIGVMRNE